MTGCSKRKEIALKMSSTNFIPMLSSSPPPIDDGDSPENDDDDDEFGTFASANHDFDSSFDSPVILKENSKNNSTQHRKEKNCIQVNCSFKGSDVPLFSNDKRNERKIKLIRDHDHESDQKSRKGDIDLESEIGDSCEADFTHVNEKHLSNHSSGAEPAATSVPPGTNEDISSQGFVPVLSMFNSSAHEECSDPVVAEASPVLKRDIPATDFSKAHHFLDVTQDAFNYTDDDDADLGDSSNFCNFESVNISERFNGEKEPCVYESDVLLRASPSNLCDRDSNDVNFPACNESDDALDKEALFSDTEKALNLHMDDYESLARTAVLDVKCGSLSSSRCSDDFDDFKFAAAVDAFETGVPVENGTSTAVLSLEHSEGSDDDENFGDFESVPSAFTIAVSAAVECNPDDDFADFESSEFQGECSWGATAAELKPAETEDFSDFMEARGTVPTPLTQVVISKGSPEGLDKIAKVICAVFPLSSSSEVHDEGECSFDTLEQNCKSRRLWEKLHEANQTPGIPFQWGVSHTFQQLLRSVNVDYHSILRTSTVPFFATGLGLLEPSKGPGTVSDKDSNNTESSEIEVGGTKDPIPPVHFDWGSSGLVNPLDSGHVASTLMDLSFLKSSEATSSNTAISKNFSLENELLKPDPDAFRNSSSKAPILEQLLSLSANTSILTTDMSGSRPPNLSKEAVHVLDQLPDISFIRAKMLMFPVSSNT